MKFKIISIIKSLIFISLLYYTICDKCYRYVRHNTTIKICNIRFIVRSDDINENPISGMSINRRKTLCTICFLILFISNFLSAPES